jgi:glycosyltransferase involved in cell wall biosynthesis
VVATAFPHAVELLSGGTGSLVPFGDPEGLARELRQILSDRPTRSLMAQRAQQLATDWYWPTIGDRFAATMSEISGLAESPADPTLDRQRVAG